MPQYKGSVEVDNKTFNWHTSFDDSVKFQCIRCGLSCIGTEVQVSDKEIGRIKAETGKSFFEEYTTPFGNKKKRLKKINNRCIFLGDKMECTIHSVKPLLCREFPFKVLFTATNQAVIDVTYGCGCMIRKDFSQDNDIDFSQLVKEHYLDSPEDASDLETFSRIVKNVKDNLDSSEAVKKCWEFIVGKLVSPIELCVLIENFQKAREEIKKLNFSNADKYIQTANEMPFKEIDWDGFMRRFLSRVISEKNNFVALEPVSLRKYSLVLTNERISFDYYFSDDKKSFSIGDVKRRIILPEGIDILKNFLGKFWDRAVTSNDFCLAMASFREQKGYFPHSIIVQLDAARFALHGLEFFLHLIAEKNCHEDITADDVKEAIVLLDGAFLAVTSSIIG